jgi:septal ring factor EnvC (AmiA/AmiB activator)
MSDILTHIQNIEVKIQKLRDLYNASLMENKKFNDLNNKLRESLNQVSQEKEQLENQYNLLLDAQKVRKGDDLSAYKKTVTKELNGYVKELDKCIELVKQS